MDRLCHLHGLRRWRASLVLLCAVLVLSAAETACKQPAARAGITREQALAIARKAFAGIGPGDLAVDEDRIDERSFGWVFYANSRRYLTTGNREDLLIGVPPLVVYRAVGETEFLTTSVDPELLIEHLERSARDGRYHQSKSAS